MNDGPRSPRRAGRVVQTLALTSVLALSVAACSGSDPAAQSAKVAPNAKTASTALDAGLKAHAAGHLTTAVADYNKTLKYDATNKFAFYNLALIDEGHSNYGLAEAKYRSALKTDPAYEPALFNLAILRTGPDATEAISLYERAVAANSKDAAAWLNLGLLLRTNGKNAAGDKDVLRAIGLNSKLVDPAKAAKTTPKSKATP